MKELFKVLAEKDELLQFYKDYLQATREELQKIDKELQLERKEK